MKTKAIVIASLFLAFATPNILASINVPPGAAVSVKEVSFYNNGSSNNFHELLSDDLSVAYVAPHWVKEEHNYSFSYTRNTLAEVSSKIQFPPALAGCLVWIRAEGTDGIDLPPALVEIQSDGMADYPRSPATKKWPDETKFYDRSDPEFEFKWYVKIFTTPQENLAGKTAHQVYVILDTPTTVRREESVFYVACNNGTEGRSIAGKDLVNDIFKRFNSKDIHPIESASGDENTSITLKFRAGSGEIVPDYEGVCKKWGEFFVDVVKVHGMTAMTHDISPAGITVPAGLKAVTKRWYVATQTLNSNGTGFNNTGGLNKGQGNAHTSTVWQGHVIASAYNFYYDHHTGSALTVLLEDMRTKL